MGSTPGLAQLAVCRRHCGYFLATDAVPAEDAAVKLRKLLAGLAGCLVLGACTPISPSPVPESTSPATAPSQTVTASSSGGILRIGQAAADLGTLDPHFGSGTQ